MLSLLRLFSCVQSSADSNYSQPSSDLSLDEEKESLRREKERAALNKLHSSRVSVFAMPHMAYETIHITIYVNIYVNIYVCVWKDRQHKRDAHIWCVFNPNYISNKHI